MFSTTRDPTDFLGMPQTYGEELASVPHDNPGLPGTSAGGSGLGAALGCDQIAAWIVRIDAIQSTTEDNRNHTVCRGTRPVCAYCARDFGRVQELKRHMDDIHMPRRRCPLCPFAWTRPGKIKAHLIADHAERFAAEMLEGIKALRGRHIVGFVDAWDTPRAGMYPTSLRNPTSALVHDTVPRPLRTISSFPFFEAFAPGPHFF